MSLMKLPCEVQTMLCASTQINSYKRAVEELVYNSLDAGSTSIAIRVHIADNAIQVVDNGQGIFKIDFKFLGHNHMTSKCVDPATLRSNPNKYGFRGESLAYIIKVSQTVEITSRHENSDGTWMKAFTNGKEGKLMEMKTRPSKGTTVAIHGFLHNLHIQKKAINPFNEMQATKSFLERLSLVHSNVSISLRDDSTNEIVFKLHKQRDKYQTLSSLFGIEATDIQELKVEKGLYKVTGLISKTDSKIGKHWIYLNGKFVHNCKLYKDVNDFFSKAIFKDTNKKAKLRNASDDSECALLKTNIPFYFIFMSCPYIDYEISSTPKQSILEFKNWEQIKKLLEKLIKFYLGDINVREIKNPAPKEAREVTETRSEVKKIIDKVLKSTSNKLCMSHMHKGIKGKIIKRNNKKKSSRVSNICLSKIIPPKHNVQSHNSDKENSKLNSRMQCNDVNITTNKETNNLKEETILPNSLVKEKMTNKYVPNKIVSLNELFEEAINQNPQFHEQIIPPTKSKNKCKNEPKTNHKHKINHHNIMKKFENPTASLKRRYEIITKEAEDILNNEKEKLRKVCKDKVIGKRYDCERNKQKFCIHEKVNAKNKYYLQIPLTYNEQTIDKYSWDLVSNYKFKTTYDLIHTILHSQREVSPNLEKKLHTETYYNKPHQFKKPYETVFNSEYQCVSKLTFESHHYNKDTTEKDKSRMYYFDKDYRNKHFITKESRDNFEDLIKQRYSKAFGGFNRRLNTKRHYKHGTNICNDIEESSYTIEFTQNSLNINSKNYFENFSSHFPTLANCNEETKCASVSDVNNYDVWHQNTNINIRNTYTVSATQKSVAVFTNFARSSEDEHSDFYKTYCILNTNSEHHIENKDTPTQNNERSVVFGSKSRSSNEKAMGIYVDPLNICETILTNNETDGEDRNKEVNDKLREQLNISHFNEADFSNEPNQNKNDNHNSEIISHHFSPSCTYNVNEPCLESNEYNIPELNDIRSDTINDQGNKELNHISLNILPELRDIELYAEEISTADENLNKQSQANGSNYKMSDSTMDVNNFQLKNRPRFLPKGMSQIFINCNSKSVCNYEFDKDYFKGNMYDDFVKQVYINSELFEPRIENVNRFTTKDIEKVSNKLNKDKASMIFNGQSLKDAKVLGQVDEKFIAAVMKGKCHEHKEISDSLILFDQHAVHERIRLEKNLSEYFENYQWKSVPVDEISLAISSDDILYLHNFKDKFTQLGLQWNILNNKEVSITAIPEAILGKNPRQVDRIMLAVKNLIAEVISMIKLQKGCVSLYPKSIMDLVFSEACRYAIRFGDKLYLNDCTRLLKELAECKTPFQCAHGRPVMAVLMDYKDENRKYEISTKSLYTFKKRPIQI